jgi:hypothetical protein
MKKFERMLWVVFLAGFMAVSPLAQAALTNQDCPPPSCCCTTAAPVPLHIACVTDYPADACDCRIEQSKPIHASEPFTCTPTQSWTSVWIEYAGMDSFIPQTADHGLTKVRHQKVARPGVPIYLVTLSILC